MKLKLCTAAVLCVALLATFVGSSFLPVGNAQGTKQPSPLGLPPQNKSNIDVFPQGPKEKSETDEVFIRRLSKDLRGTEPTPAEVHFFVSSKEEKKRDKLIDLFIQERQARKQGKQPELKGDSLFESFDPYASKTIDLEALQQDYDKKLQSAKDKEEMVKITQALVDRLIEFGKENPNSKDITGVIKMIASLCDALGKVDEAKAWREKLPKQELPQK